MTTSLIQSFNRFNRPNGPHSRETRNDVVRSDIRDNLISNRFVLDRIQDRIGYSMRRRFQREEISRAGVKAEMRAFGEVVATAMRSQDSDDWDAVVEGLNDRWSWIKQMDSGKWVGLLNDHTDHHWECCSDCSKIELEDAGIWCYDGDYWVCEDCGEQNYRYADWRDTYISLEDWNDEYEDNREDEDDSIIGEYHSGKRVLGHIPSEYDKFKPRVLLGMELEMEVDQREYGRSDRAELISDAISIYSAPDNTKHRYCAFESDGSLDYGFEMVTGYTGLDVHARQLAFFRKRLEGVRSHDTRTCGLHVHVCKSDMNLFHAAKLVLFINGSDNQRLMKSIARRDGSSRYSQIKNKKADYSWLKQAKAYQRESTRKQALRNINSDRYEAINFQNENTIEFRLFKGTLKYETIMSCLEFAFMAWHFSRDAGVNDLTSDKFVEYICLPENRKHSRFLREYLRTKGFNISRAKVNPRVAVAPTEVTADI